MSGKRIRLLDEFIEFVKDDSRISPVHMSLYAVIFCLWIRAGGRNPIGVGRDELMQLSRISGRNTLYKSLKDLQELGFLNYKPQANQFAETVVYLMDPEKKLCEYKIK